MSQAEFKKARNRSRRAKNDIFWALRVLKDPETISEAYILRETEKEQFRLSLQEDLEEILVALAQVFSSRETISSEKINTNISILYDLATELTEVVDTDTYLKWQNIDIVTESGKELIENAPNIPDWPKGKRVEREEAEAPDIPDWPTDA